MKKTARSGDDYLAVVYNDEEKPYTRYPRQLTRYLIERFALSAPDRLLDLGCGRGEFLDGFLRCGLDAHGLDISATAKRLCPAERIKIADLDKLPLPFENAGFDCVFSKSVLEHFYYPEKICAEIFRLLKPGGLAITMVPDWHAVYRTSFYEDHTHRTPFTRMSLERLLRMSGFEQVAVEKFRQLPFVWQRPWLGPFCFLIARFTPDAWRARFKLVRFSKELMLLSTAVKPG